MKKIKSVERTPEDQQGHDALMALYGTYPNAETQRPIHEWLKPTCNLSEADVDEIVSEWEADNAGSARDVELTALADEAAAQLNKLISLAEGALAGNTIALTGKSKEERLALLRGEEKLDRINREIAEDKFVNLSNMTREERRARWMQSAPVTPVPVDPNDIQVMTPEDFTDDDIARIMRDVPGWVDPRLQQLREEFEASHARHAAGFAEDGLDYLDADYVAAWKTEKYEVNPCSVELAMIAAARRYIIARDFNVFDPDKADMLWKLQRQ